MKALWAVALPAIAFASPAGGEPLISSANFVAERPPVAGQCLQQMPVFVYAEDPGLFDAEFEEFQRLLGGARAALSFECPQMQSIAVVGRTHSQIVWSGTMAASNEWRLVSLKEAMATKPAPPPLSVASPPAHQPRAALQSGNARMSSSEGALEASRSGGLMRREQTGRRPLRPEYQGLHEEEQRRIELSVSRPPIDVRCGAFRLQADGVAVSMEEIKRRFPNDAWMSEIDRQRRQFDTRCYAAVHLGRPQICGDEDLACLAASACSHPYATSEEVKAPSKECMADASKRIQQERQQVLAATIAGATGEGMFTIYRRPGTAGRELHWCGPKISGSLTYSTGEKIAAVEARTIKAILDDGLSERCPEARFIDVAAAGSELEFQRAFVTGRLEKTGWAVSTDPSWVASRPTQVGMLDVLLATGKDLGAGMAKAVEYGKELDARADAAAVQRQAGYAREGKVCKMKPSVAWCFTSESNSPSYAGGGLIINNVTKTSTCSGLCSGHDGYCDMETGQRFFDAEAAERANCRQASSGEIAAALEASEIDASIRPRPYMLKYTAR